MRRRKRTEFFKLCGLCLTTIIINFLSLICTLNQASALELAERMEIVRKVLREVPLIDGWVDSFKHKKINSFPVLFVMWKNKSNTALNYGHLHGSLNIPINIFTHVCTSHKHTALIVYLNQWLCVHKCLFLPHSYMCCGMKKEQKSSSRSKQNFSAVLHCYTRKNNINKSL